VKNVLILTYWSFTDALIQTYTLPYVRLIKKNIGKDGKIFLLTLEQKFFKMNDDEWEKEQLKYRAENIVLIRFKYDHFGLKMVFRVILLLFSLVRLINKENVGFIHAWCTPAGAIGYILSKFTNTDLIIDSYEPHAESMVENGTWNRSSFKFKLLFWLEKKQSQKASNVIALTQGMRNYAKLKYDVTFENYYVKPALVNLDKFSWKKDIYQNLRENKNFEDKVICVYAGKLGGIYLEEDVFDFIKVASDFWKEKFKMYLLTDKNIDEVDAFIKQKKIPANCVETHFVAHKEIQDYYQLADFAINPVKPVPSKRYCTSIKDGEYWAMGLPVVITKDISDDSDIIKEENIGYVLNSLTDEEYKKACLKINTLLSEDKTLSVSKIQDVAFRYRRFEIAEKIYKELYA
jgi:glycosyltransferase involved in cell wall biosynthesis